MDNLSNDVSDLFVSEVNTIIAHGAKNKLAVGQVSDGYHTFNELYDHRIELFIALCHALYSKAIALRCVTPIWRSMSHSDGSLIDGWFIMGINKGMGKQITYHLPLSKWEDCDFAETLGRAPQFDGHTSNDVLERLKSL